MLTCLPTTPTLTPDTLESPQLDARSADPAANALTVHQQLLQQLHTSLELERVLTTFFEYLQRLLGVERLRYQHTDIHFETGLARSAAQHQSYAISHEQECLGQLSLFKAQTFSNAELMQLELLTQCLLYPLRNALLYYAAIRSSLLDPLTSIGNRHAMQQALEREMCLAWRTQQPLSVLMLDIDHFKRINDAHGHSQGDDVLIAVAHALKNQLRGADRVFRFGGEEFVVLLTNTDALAAKPVAERLRKAVQRLQLGAIETPIRVCISLGCASLQAGEERNSLLRRADQALYQSKRSGRNCLSMAP